jgi:hypothetical protein
VTWSKTFWSVRSPGKNLKLKHSTIMSAFNLEKEIAAWRKQLELNRTASRQSLDELESHLRDEFARWQGIGLSEAERFQIAAGRIGAPFELKHEFAKVEHWRFRDWCATPTPLTVLGVWFVLMGVSGISFMPAFAVMGLSETLLPTLICAALCVLQIMIGVGITRRSRFWRSAALGWAGIFLIVALASLHPLNGIVQHFIFWQFHFPDAFFAKVESLSHWQLVLFTRSADVRHVTDFLSPAILIWGIWLLTRRNVRELFQRNWAERMT